MAIQIPNPGTGNGATGDNEFVLWTKVKDNFSNTTHAASRLVGTATGNVMEVGAFGIGGSRESYPATTLTSTKDGFIKLGGDHGGVIPTSGYAYSGFNMKDGGGGTVLVTPTSAGGAAVVKSMGYRFITYGYSNNTLESVAIYTTGNTTKDAGTGFLKASSPVLHVYNDKIDKIHEAEQLDITVDKKGVGHYEIHGTTGLRQNDGWNMSPPRDIHGNVRCMIEVTEKDGVITVKTYKRKFDLELAAVVHDYDNPLDIPDGACVELRFNDLPLDDFQTEV